MLLHFQEFTSTVETTTFEFSTTMLETEEETEPTVQTITFTEAETEETIFTETTTFPTEEQTSSPEPTTLPSIFTTTEITSASEATSGKDNVGV